MTANDNLARTPWWLWPNVLSLDAPVIAVLWQAIFARSANFPPAWPERTGLFLAVWLIYAADRMLDSMRLTAGPTAPARQQFSRRHGRGIAAAIAAGLLVAGVLVIPRLPTEVLWGGVFLGAIVGIYFVWNQLSGARFGRGWLKESVVSVVFAGGAGLAPLIHRPSIDLAAGIFGLAVVCMANCLLIARLERDRDIERGELSIAARFSATARPARRLAIGFGLVLCLWSLVAGWDAVRLALLGSCVLLAFGPLIERRFGNDAGCLWADLCLLTPVFLLW